MHLICRLRDHVYREWLLERQRERTPLISSIGNSVETGAETLRQPSMIYHAPGRYRWFIIRRRRAIVRITVIAKFGSLATIDLNLSVSISHNWAWLTAITDALRGAPSSIRAISPRMPPAVTVS